MRGPVAPPIAWSAARAVAYAAGRAALSATEVPLADAEGLTLAEGLRALTPLPAFPTSSVDGYAVRGAAPWRITATILAGSIPLPLADGCAAEIATGAPVPEHTEAILRVEDSIPAGDGRVTGTPRAHREWRDAGEEAGFDEELVPTGTPITPAVVGLAATCGYDTLRVVPAPTAAVVIFGDELATAGPPGNGRVRDSLGPQLPGWLRRLGARPVPGFAPRGPVRDTLDAHLTAIRDALEVADLVCTTGGTMHGPVDHLHPALVELGADHLVDTAAVRPGYPMLLAALPAGPTGRDRPRFIAGLPGNPQSAIVALVTLVVPLLAAMAGRAEPVLGSVTLGAPIPGRGDHTHLALVRVEPDGRAYPLPHTGSAMLRGLARSDGFAVITPGTDGPAGATVPLVPLPLLPGERP